MKKILPLILAVVMIVGATVTVLAAPNSNAKITGMAQPLTVGYSGSPDLGDIEPQDKRVEYIDLVDTMFTWDTYTPDVATPANIPANILRNAKLDVRASNNRVLESVTLNSSRSRIEVQFVSELVDTKDIDFEFDVFLSINGRRQTDYPITFTGTLANPVYEVYANTEHEDISRGEVAEAQENIRSIVLDAGMGVKITTRMMNGDRMYAVASRTPDLRDEAIFAENRIIQDVLHLSTSGVKSNAVVNLDEEFRSYYVYNSEGKYLGKGNENLPLSATYYLSKDKIETANEPANTDESANTDEPASTPAPVEHIPLPSDNDMSSPTNVNDNPNTGR